MHETGVTQEVDQLKSRIEQLNFNLRVGRDARLEDAKVAQDLASDLEHLINILRTC